MLESSLEGSIRDYVRKCGGRALKFVSPGCPGVPDRICVFPGARIIFVELKRPGLKDGRSPQQKKIGRLLRRFGFTVWLINDRQDFIEKLSGIGVKPQ
jgi:hypothetical protein